MIENHMAEKEFNFIQDRDKTFIVELTKALEKMGYTYGDEIGSGYIHIFFRFIYKVKVDIFAHRLTVERIVGIWLDISVVFGLSVFLSFGTVLFIVLLSLALHVPHA